MPKAGYDCGLDIVASTKDSAPLSPALAGASTLQFGLSLPCPVSSSHQRCCVAAWLNAGDAGSAEGRCGFVEDGLFSLRLAAGALVTGERHQAHRTGPATGSGRTGAAMTIRHPRGSCRDHIRDPDAVYAQNLRVVRHGRERGAHSATTVRGYEMRSAIRSPMRVRVGSSAGGSLAMDARRIRVCDWKYVAKGVLGRAAAGRFRKLPQPAGSLAHIRKSALKAEYRR